MKKNRCDYISTCVHRSFLLIPSIFLPVDKEMNIKKNLFNDVNEN